MTRSAGAGWTTRPGECWMGHRTTSGGSVAGATMSSELVVDPKTGPPMGSRHAGRSDGRIVLQAWIASRGLIAGVALLLAVLEGRRLTEQVSNWDVQHFGRL